jgi:hypothetical protein
VFSTIENTHMGKYSPLMQFLEGCTTEEVPMTFSEIERVIGAELPVSKAYPAWWSNNPSNNVMTKAWLAAGFRTERVDTAGEKLVFRRDRSGRSLRTISPPGAKVGVLQRLRANLAGTVHVPEGVDLTEPTGEAWDADR